MKKQLCQCESCAEKLSTFLTFMRNEAGGSPVEIVIMKKQLCQCESCAEKLSTFLTFMRNEAGRSPVEIATTDDIAQKLKDGCRLEVAGIFDENGRLLQLSLMDIPAKIRIGWCREGYRHREFRYIEPKDAAENGWYPVYGDK